MCQRLPTHLLGVLAFVTCLSPATGLAASAKSDEEQVPPGLLLAVKRASSEAIKERTNQPTELLIEQIKIELLNNVAKNRVEISARNTTQRLIDEDLNQRIRNTVSIIIKNLASQDEKLKKLSVKTLIDDQLQTVVDGAKSKFNRDHSNQVFSTAWKRALQSQREQLVKNAFPNQEQANEVAASGWTSDLSKVLKGRIEANMPELFNEVEAESQDILQSIRNRVEQQVDAQRQVVRGDVEQTASSAEAIAQDLRARMRAQQSAMQSTVQTGEPVYSTFPTLEADILKRSKELERQRWIKYAEGYQGDFSQVRLLQEIVGNLSGHRTLVDSQHYFKNQLAPLLIDQALTGYTAQVGTKDVQEMFRSRLRKLTDHDEAAKKAIEAATTRGLSKDLRDARNKVAEQQLARHFPAVVTGEYVIPEPTLLENDLNKLNLHTFGQAVSLPLITANGDPYRSSELLQEIETLLVRRLGKLIEEGATAWEAQKQMIEEFVVDIEKELAGSSDIGSLTEQQWVKKFTKKFETKWANDRVSKIWRGMSSPPAYAATKYQSLFGQTRKEILEKVHSFFTAEQIPPGPGVGIDSPIVVQTAPETIVEIEPNQTAEKLKSQQEAIESNKETQIASKQDSGVGEESKEDSGAGVGQGGANAAAGENKIVEWPGSKANSEGTETEPSSWLWWLIVLLILLFVVITLLALWIVRLKIHERGNQIENRVRYDVPDVEASSKWIELGLNLQPKKSSESEAVFQLGPESELILTKASPV